MAANATQNEKPQTAPKTKQQLSNDELDRVTEVFKMYETGLREATIYPKVILMRLPLFFTAFYKCLYIQGY